MTPDDAYKNLVAVQRAHAALAEPASSPYSEGLTASAASAFLRERGVRHALGGTGALLLRGLVYDGVRDLDFLVDRLPQIPPYVEVVPGASVNQGEGVEDDGVETAPHGVSLRILGAKVDLIPVGTPFRHQFGYPMPAEDAAWLARASPLAVSTGRGFPSPDVPVLLTVDVLRWKWCAGRQKDLEFLAALNADAHHFSPPELGAIAELAAAARFALKLAALPPRETSYVVS